jgi:thioredoxin-related protein
MNYQALDDRNEVTDFTDSFGVEYPNVLYIDNLKPFEKFVIRVLPTTIIYDKNGKELINYEGLIDKPFLQHTILNHK